LLLGRNQSTIISAAQVPQLAPAATVAAAAANIIHQVRKLLDEEGGPAVKVVAQIDTGSAIRNYDEILRVADAIMISRTNLGMVIRPEKASARLLLWLCLVAFLRTGMLSSV
jgi:hypothetical protein